jgi:hypothetical protein
LPDRFTLYERTANMMRSPGLGFSLLIVCAQTVIADEVPVESVIPDVKQLEAEGAVIHEVILDKRNIFDLSDPKENKWLYRWANRLHIVTRDSVIDNQLLFRPGDTVSSRRASCVRIDSLSTQVSSPCTTRMASSTSR